MANKASAKKEIRKNIKRNLQNTSIRSRASTFLKKAEVAIKEGTFDDAMAAIRKYVSIAMKAAKVNILSKLAVARKNSRLVIQLKKKHNSFNAS